MILHFYIPQQLKIKLDKQQEKLKDLQRERHYLRKHQSSRKAKMQEDLNRVTQAEERKKILNEMLHTLWQ